ncbi:prepilin-type N-terminal cleavage/methylation domain-containing protein [Modicisalibacter muralis]|uniref:Prepilin-type N-terminal cleavage/methylation domain-containing protein n=1 Tax=Modicisalibacter muralis TaxID=119000 RepID=A0A1G9QL69_9GAMM|nr:prepilin-type N-terminal cleavage/methylation domain-containing protein [Halomonas muralis]SDM11764.1 prepilin-type N-terminal cleavage/methylation domain-containing protein [Halomonas muralis]
MKVSSHLANSELPIRSRQQCGFTLIELMVSLLIGLMIMLGASQLFIVSRQSFEQVEVLGIKQGALSFTTDVLASDIRNAERDGIETKDDGDILILDFSGNQDVSLCSDEDELVRKYYRLGESPENSGEYSLLVNVVCESGEIGYQPLVAGFVENSLDFDGMGNGLWRVTFKINGSSADAEDETDGIVFLAMNRAAAIKRIDEEDEDDD